MAEPLSFPPNEIAAHASPKLAGVAHRWMILVVVLAFLFVLMPYLFWQATWFGRPLSDAQIEKNLADRQHPRNAQHALSQIADRMNSPNPAVRASARRWYPQIMALASSNVDELRLTAAWVMGQEGSVRVPKEGCPVAAGMAAWAISQGPEVLQFQQRLIWLLEDPNPMVRRNAALSLVHYCHAAGRPVILEMLSPYDVPSPRAGTLAQRLKVGEAVNPGTLLGRVKDGAQETEIRTQVPGTVERWLVADGSAVSAGQSLVALASSPEMVWEALRALYLIGQPEDLPGIDRYARGAPDLPDKVRQQADLTVHAIRGRATSPSQ